MDTGSPSADPVELRCPLTGFISLCATARKECGAKLFERTPGIPLSREPVRARRMPTLSALHLRDIAASPCRPPRATPSPRKEAHEDLRHVDSVVAVSIGLARLNESFAMMRIFSRYRVPKVRAVSGPFLNPPGPGWTHGRNTPGSGLLQDR